MSKAISRALLGKIVDEVFGGAVEDASVIEEIYAVFKREEAALSAPEPLAWYWEDKSGCFHIVMDRADVQEMAAEFFCDPKPLYPEALLPAVSMWKTMDTAPRNGTVIQAWHTIHKCPISILWNNNGHEFNGETLHWFERSYTTVWPEHVFSHWMPLPSQPAPEGGGT